MKIVEKVVFSGVGGRNVYIIEWLLFWMRAREKYRCFVPLCIGSSYDERYSIN